MEDKKQKLVHKNALSLPVWIFYPLFATVLFFAGCSFDYGAGQGDGNNRPDIVMENLDYVRVRKGDLLARFHAEEAERLEERQVMILRDFSFEQMEDHGETVNVEGRAGTAEVQIVSGDISFYNGVRFNIESEDIILRATGIEWKDREKTLTGYPDDDVYIDRSDGTSFTGKGLSADIRSRKFVFSGEVSGIFVEDEEEEETGEEDVDE